MRRSVYFVGTGLTKSLELSNKPVPMMYDFVSVLANYLHNNVILTALAELENEGLYRWKDVEAQKLAKSLVGPNADLTPDKRANFARALKNKPSESIEDLLRREEEKTSPIQPLALLGWSMPETDKDQTDLISSAIEERSSRIERITVVNRHAAPEYFERIACVFGVRKSQLRAFNAGFVDFVADIMAFGLLIACTLTSSQAKSDKTSLHFPPPEGCRGGSHPGGGSE